MTTLSEAQGRQQTALAGQASVADQGESNLPEWAEAEGTAARPMWGYYRQSNGWITVSPIGDFDELKYRRSGWEPLHQYGHFDMTSGYAANHPLEALFMQRGTHELPADQVIEMGLYLNPPLVPTCHKLLTQFHKKHTGACFVGAKPIHFPQIEGRTDLGPFGCRFCERQFSLMAAQNQHMKVAHKDELLNIRSGEALAEALLKGIAALQVPAPAVPTAVATLSESALQKLVSVGLNKKQRDALLELGIDLGDKDGEEE